MKFLQDRYELLQRRFGHGYRDRTVGAADFLGWALRIDLEMPADLRELLKRYHMRSSVSQAAAAAPERTDKREIDKVAQLVVAMAIDGYGYDPDARRSAIPKEIADAAAKYGAEIHPDTIRKYLRIGASFLAPDWKRADD